MIPRLAQRKKPWDDSPPYEETPETAHESTISTDLVVIPASEPITSTSLVAITSPARVVETASAATKEPIGLPIPVIIVWIFLSWLSYLLQEFAAWTQAQGAGRPASEPSSDLSTPARISEYKEDTDVHLPVASSQHVSAPKWLCAPECPSKVAPPLQIKGSSSVMSVRCYVQKEQTPVDVRREVRKAMGNMMLGFRATVSICIKTFRHGSY